MKELGDEKPRFLEEEEEEEVQKEGCNFYTCTGIIAKCRECHETNQEDKDYCRFYGFRKIAKTKKGLIIVSGFNDPFADADDSDRQLWLPKKDINKVKYPEETHLEELNKDWELDIQSADQIICQTGHQFRDLVDEENSKASNLNNCAVVWKRLVKGVREMCDHCETTIFNYHWTCGKCGFEVCIDCYEAQKKNTLIPTESSKDSDQSSWLLCTNLQTHAPNSLLLTQIIPANCLNIMHRMINDCRSEWPLTMTSIESQQMQTDVPHSRLCKGELLHLHDPKHPNNYQIFQDQWKRGRPVLVSNIHKNLDEHLWHPKSFSKDFGRQEYNFLDCRTGTTVKRTMEQFWGGFEQISNRLKDSKGDPVLLSLKDWPPTSALGDILPEKFADFVKCIPLSEYTHRYGRLNLASRLPNSFRRPDLGPIMDSGYGLVLYPDKGTTNLHLDISDSVHVMVYVGISKIGTRDKYTKEALKAVDEAGCDAVTRRRVQEKNVRPGALWHIYKACDADQIRDMLKTVAKERGDPLIPHHDPIHDHRFYLNGPLRDRLKTNHGVEGYPIVQCQGDAVFVPAGAPYQVRNLHSCINVSQDFVSPENISQCFRLTQEFRALSDTHKNREDKLQIKNILYHAVKDSLTVLQTSSDKILDNSETTTTTSAATTVEKAKDGCENISIECVDLTYDKICKFDVPMVTCEEEVEEKSESDYVEESKPQKEKKAAKRKHRKKTTWSDGDTSSSVKKHKSKWKRIKTASGIESDEDDNSLSKGRKNIQNVVKDKAVADDERQNLSDEVFDARVASHEKVEKLVLDLDKESKKELVVVHEELVKLLKPHQAQGIKFMWDACYESLKQIKKSEGSGCIIAHCMGLGKTFQVVTLIHTLITHEETGVNTIMVVCPLSTVLSWCNEFEIWLKHVPDADEIEIYDLTKYKSNIKRCMLESWQKTGGVLILSYEMFLDLTSNSEKMRQDMQQSIMKSIVNPGADLVICDEGHLLKNEDSAVSKAIHIVKTKRRIVLTGIPLQNNLQEYHCMVQFVQPNLLGTKEEFLKRFVNPIRNGQRDDSTPCNVKHMKKRTYVLHKILEGSVQRLDYSVLKPFLPPKKEYDIFVCLSDVQIKMYQHYLDNFARRHVGKNGSLFADFQVLQRIWTHPYVLRLNAAEVAEENGKKLIEASISKVSLNNFIDDEYDSKVSSAHNSSESDSDVQCIISDDEKKATKLTKSARMNNEFRVDDILVPTIETIEDTIWWSKYLEEEQFNDMRFSTKLRLLFGIVKESEKVGDKVLVFSQSLYSLSLVEHFLKLIDKVSQNDKNELEKLDNHSGSWAFGLDYFRLDESTSPENCSAWCKIFNSPKNSRARLFLISTVAGGLGINLTAANRVIIFDASWNPSHDEQSIIKIYRFRQKKPCYIYRFLAAGTMEEEIYNRQIANWSYKLVDELQIERHYSKNDLAKLYQFETCNGQSSNLERPKDNLLADTFLKYGNLVLKYHERDLLLKNNDEEDLDEEEKKQAWLEYEEEKQGKRQIINTLAHNSCGVDSFMNMNNLNSLNLPEMESIKLLIQKNHPQLPPDQIETVAAVARQIAMNMYQIVD